MKAALVVATACALVLSAAAAVGAAVPRAASTSEDVINSLQSIPELAEGSRATLELCSDVDLARGAPLPIRLPNADITLQAAGAARRTLDVEEGQQLLVVPAGSSLTLHNLDIRVGPRRAPATQPPPHIIDGLPLWPTIQLEPGAALHLSSVSISLPASQRCVPAAWRQLSLKLPVPVHDARPGILAPGGTVAVTLKDTSVTCAELSVRRGRTTLQASARQAGTPLQLMVALVSALGLDAGNSAIEITSDIALTQADVAGHTLPLRLAPNHTLVIEGGPGEMKRLDFGGVRAPQLLFLEPGSTLVFSNINVSGWADPSVGHASLPTHTDALPTWPTIGGAPGSKIEFKDAYLLDMYELCTPEFAQAQATGLQQQAKGGDWVEWIPGTAALHFDQFSSQLPIFNATDQSQIGLFGFNTTNTTMGCTLPSNGSSGGAASTASSGGDGGSSFPVAAVVVPVAVVAAAVLVGGLLLWHRRRKRGRELLPMTSKPADSSMPYNASSEPGTPPPGNGSPNTSGNLGMLTPGGSQDLAKAAGDLSSGMLISRVGFIEGLSLGRALGGGGYGRVFLGRWRGATVAVKVVPATIEAGQRVDLSREPLLSVLLQHPNITTSYKTCVVRILSADSGHAAAEPDAATATAPTSSGGSGGGSKGPTSQGGGRVVRSLTDRNALVEVVASDAVLEPGMYEAWIVSEYADRGSLHEAIIQGLFKAAHPPGWDLEALLLCLLDIARGLEFLHSCSIIHGDLKPQNVLLKTEKCAHGRRDYVAKLADFGLSRIMGEEQTCVETGNYGTATHAAPERIADGRLTFASDIYSWEMLSGQRMWAGIPTLQIISLVTLKNYRPPAPEGCPAQLAELMQRCWQADPRARPDAAGVIEALIAYAATLRDSMRPAASAPEQQPAVPRPPTEQPQ